MILFLLFRWEEEQLPEGVKWLKMEHKVNQMDIGCIHKWQLSNYSLCLIANHSHWPPEHEQTSKEFLL